MAVFIFLSLVFIAKRLELLFFQHVPAVDYFLFFIFALAMFMPLNFAWSAAIIMQSAPSSAL